METQEKNWNIIHSFTDTELVTHYVEREKYVDTYVDALIEELSFRGISPKELTSKDAAILYLFRKKTDGELRDTYLNIEEYPKKIRDLAEQEAVRRGLSIDIDGKKKAQAELREGVPGNPLVIVLGYFLSLGIIGLVIALNYVFSQVYTNDGYVYKYNKNTRIAGVGMLALFVVSVVIAILSLIY
ncbi:MAG: hypothetical protein LBB85_02765 [Dysgonamonadaceae bacterium]|nr:hypothetical protein [Dysgonamonadaceae bacterium]